MWRVPHALGVRYRQYPSWYRTGFGTGGGVVSYGDASVPYFA